MLQESSEWQRKVLEKLGKCTLLRHVTQAHGALTVLGHAHAPLCAFKLVRAAAIAPGGLAHALLFFDCLDAPNVHHYAALLTALAAHGRHRAAVELYRLMLRRGACRPNQFIFPQLLKSATEAILPRAAGSVHAQIIKFGFERHPIVQTGLVGLYAKAPANVGFARNVFDEMSERGVVPWTAMVSGYIRLGDVGNAMALFEEMPERDTAAWNAVIVGCTQNGLFSLAVSLFARLMIEERCLRPNGVTVASAISACGHGGTLRLGRCIHGYAWRHRLESDPFVSSALVDMYGKCGHLREAKTVFDAIPRKRTSSWNSMINCYALHGQDEDAIRVFEEMIACEKSDAIKPDGITFVGLLNACAHGGLVEEGVACFRLMTEKYAIDPRIEHYGCLIDLLGRAGRFDDAMDVVKGMEFEPDEVVWSSLLNGCKIHGRLDLAEFALRKLMEAEPENGGHVSALANVYGELGKWEEVRKLRRASREKCGHKTPGCSWIEVEEGVSQFFSADISHARAQQIYGVLEHLQAFMVASEEQMGCSDVKSSLFGLDQDLHSS